MIILALPAYNEAKSLPAMLPKIDKLFDSFEMESMVIVCDDASNDNTKILLDKYSKQYKWLEYFSHKINRGLGETARDLIEAAVAHGQSGDIIIRFDCDDTHEPEFIPSMIEKINNGADVVIASRFQKGGGQLGVSAYRALISRCANIFMKCFFPMKNVKEYSCGFRAYRYDILKKAIDTYGNEFIQLKGLGFTCTLEKLIKLNFLGAKFDEAPFKLRYDQKKSASKMVSSITTLGYIVLVIMCYWPFGGWRSKYKSLRK